MGESVQILIYAYMVCKIDFHCRNVTQKMANKYVHWPEIGNKFFPFLKQ